MTTVKVAVVGGSGYGSRELLGLLARHPQVQIEAVCSRDADRPAVASFHPRLRGLIDLNVEPFDARTLADRCDAVFLGLPHKASMDATKQLLEHDVRVIDLSADYRLKDKSVYQQWYDTEHIDPANLAHAVYGMPEFFRSQIADARLVACPGCFPSSIVLGLAPLVTHGLIDLNDIICDSKSGVSGAGRSLTLATHYAECNEAISAYKVGQHRHTPEIEQILTGLAGHVTKVIFTPHLVPMDQGILSTVYCRPVQPIDQPKLLQLARDEFENDPFIRVVDHLPSTKDSQNTNFYDVTYRLVGDRVLMIGCLDNLIKGAAGAAVQSFNIMFGFPETTALL